MYKDKVVVITGGSQGIGQHLALAYLEQQAKVYRARHCAQ